MVGMGKLRELAKTMYRSRRMEGTQQSELTVYWPRKKVCQLRKMQVNPLLRLAKANDGRSDAGNS